MNRAYIAILALVLLFALMAGTWSVLAARMRSDFVEALRNGQADQLLPELRDKVWTDDELAGAEVIKLIQSTGKQRALTRLLYQRGREILSAQANAYQATIADSRTGITYVFGYRRKNPAWVCDTVHPDSAPRRIQLMQQEGNPIHGAGLPQQP